MVAPVGGFASALSAKLPCVLFATVVMSLVALVIFMYWHRGPKTYLPVLAWLASLTSMSITLRVLFEGQHFDFPRFTTACHFVATAIVAPIIMWAGGFSRTRIDRRTFLKGVCPAAFSLTISICLFNIGISRSSAHFYEMVASLTPMLTAAIAFMMGRKVPSVLWLPLVFSSLGLAVCVSGEFKFSWMALICLSLGCLARSTKSVLYQLLMSDGTSMAMLHPLELAFYTCCVCACFTIPWSLCTEGLRPLRSIGSFGTFAALMATVTNACVINLSSTYVVKEIGAVAGQLVGTIKGGVTCVGAFVLIGEDIQSQQVFGYLVVITGVIVYNRIEKDLARKDSEKAGLMAASPHRRSV